LSGGISIHIVDASRGVPAQGMKVDLYRLGDRRSHLASGSAGAGGAVDLPTSIAQEPQPAGQYEAVFHVGPYCRGRGDTLPSPAFLEQVPYVFGIADPQQHYHLPLKVTPWGFSLFRGGA
jgi:5-hydroxyisourate hydrolase